MKKFTTLYVTIGTVGLIFSIGTANIARADNAATSGAATRDQTVYETHAGLFEVKNAAFNTARPLWQGHLIVDKPIFALVGKTDQVVGRTLHAREYGEDDDKSFITTDDPDGAKLGFAF